MPEEPVLPLVVEYYPGLEPPEPIPEPQPKSYENEPRMRPRTKAIIITVVPILLAIACWIVVPMAIQRIEDALTAQSP